MPLGWGPPLSSLSRLRDRLPRLGLPDLLRSLSLSLLRDLGLLRPQSGGVLSLGTKSRLSTLSFLLLLSLLSPLSDGASCLRTAPPRLPTALMILSPPLPLPRVILSEGLSSGSSGSLHARMRLEFKTRSSTLGVVWL